MRNVLFAIFFFLCSTPAVFAASTYDATILGGVTKATSSANLLTSYSNLYDQAIYRTDETGKPAGTGFTCNGTNMCGMSTRAPVLGQCITRSINTTGDSCGSLNDGYYTFFDVSAGTGCDTMTIAQCAAGTRTGKYINVQICSDGSCLVATSTTETSTEMTTLEVLIYDLLIGGLFFLVVVGVIYFLKD